MNSNWYIAHVLSGSENKVKQAILEQAQKKGLSHLFEEILIPAALVPELKKGKQVNTEKRILPGYILIKMHFSDEGWHLVKSIPKVSGFLGNNGKPVSVSEAEVARIMDQLSGNSPLVTAKKIYEEGEKVKVIDGPFESFIGIIQEVDIDKMRLRVSVSIFGRSTPIDLSFSQVERV
ncbi:MAG: transcription termination/antitermination factor NusG [Alphaproteobacteria bacterium]|nr:transcription termination/antitermination factor NusG [Alphaproteobacteria bacterium]